MEQLSAAHVRRGVRILTLALCLQTATALAQAAPTVAPPSDVNFPWSSGDDPIGVRREDTDLDRGAPPVRAPDAQAYGPRPPALSARSGDIVTATSAVRESQHRVHIEWLAGLALTTVELRFIATVTHATTTTHAAEVKYRLAIPATATLASLEVCLPAGCRSGVADPGATLLSAYDDAVQARGAGSGLPVAHAHTITDERGRAISLRAAPVRADHELVVRVAYILEAPVRGGVVRFALPARGVDERAAAAAVTLNAPDLVSISLAEASMTSTPALIEAWRPVNVVARFAATTKRPHWLHYNCGGRSCARVWHAQPAAPPLALDVSLVLDASASMRGPARGRIAAALAATLALLPPERPISVAIFAATAAMLHDATAAGNVGIIPLVDATHAEAVGSGTRFRTAWAALETWRRRPARARGGKLVVVFGDGTVSPGQDAAFEEAGRTGIAISWVNLADNDADPALQKLVRLTGGIIVDAAAASAATSTGGDPGVLEEVLSELLAPTAASNVVVEPGIVLDKKRIIIGTLRSGFQLLWTGPTGASSSVVLGGRRWRAASAARAAARRRPRGTAPPIEALLSAGLSFGATELGALSAVDGSDISVAGLNRPPVSMQCDPRGPAFRQSGISSDSDPIWLAETRPCRAPSPTASARSNELGETAPPDSSSVPGTGMPSSPLLSMLRQRILPVARGCFRRDRAGRAEYELRAVFELELSNQEVTVATVTGDVPESLRACLTDAADHLDVPLFTGKVRARYPLRTQSETLPHEIELSPAVKSDLDRLLDDDGGALHTPPAF